MVSKIYKILCTGLLAFPSQGWADADATFGFFAEESKVLTASRREQRSVESPVTVDVITKEEIASSKALNLTDLLRFRAGVDVYDGINVTHNRAIVSVRGYPEEFVRGLQVLVDGRSVYTPN